MIHLFERYAHREMQVEAEDSKLAGVMTCYGMSIDDGLHYAREARTCVGSERAYWAAAAGNPFLLPWRGPTDAGAPAPSDGLRVEPRLVDGQPDQRRLCVMLDDQVVLEFDPRVVSSQEALRLATLRHCPGIIFYTPLAVLITQSRR